MSYPLAHPWLKFVRVTDEKRQQEFLSGTTGWRLSFSIRGAEPVVGQNPRGENCRLV
jgi:hypothetical protein